MTLSRHTTRLTALLAALWIVTPATADATLWLVPGDHSGTCSPEQPNCSSIAAALAAASSGDTVLIAPGTYAESALQVTRPVTIAGAGADVTHITPSGVGFHIEANDVHLRDLTIQGATDAIRLGMPTAAVDGLRLTGIHLTDNTSDGIEIGQILATDTVIDGCTFARNANGIRMASRSTVEGITVSNSSFEDHGLIGIYQANDGNTSRLTGLEVRDSTFLNNGDSGIFVEEIRTSTIAGNVFTDNYRGITIFKHYASSGVAVGDVAIRDNTFIDSEISTIVVYVYSSGIEGPIAIEANRFSADVAKLAFLVSPIDIRLRNSFAHDPVRVVGNRITYHGGATVAPTAWAIQVRGNGPVEVAGNILDGGDAVGTVIPTAGIVLRATDSTFGTIASDAVVTASCNRIFGFGHGASVMSGSTFAPTNLPVGVDFLLADNAIAGNLLAGVVGGDAPPSIAASNNWWGCSGGPGEPGCDEVIGTVESAPALAGPPTCLPCLTDVECDDGNLCTQDACDDLGQCSSEAVPRPPSSCTTAASTTLVLGRGARPGAKRLTWTASGPGGGGELGAPNETTRSALCVYDSAAGERSLALSLPIEAGALWRPIAAAGFRYANRTGDDSGIRSAVLRTRRDGSVALSLRARGPALPIPETLGEADPMFSQDPDIVIQWTNDAGGCWSSTLELNATHRNTAKSFAAKAEP